MSKRASNCLNKTQRKIFLLTIVNNNKIMLKRAKALPPARRSSATDQLSDTYKKKISGNRKLLPLQKNIFLKSNLLDRTLYRWWILLNYLHKLIILDAILVRSFTPLPPIESLIR